MELNETLKSGAKKFAARKVDAHRQPDLLAEREAHLRALQQQLAAQERDFQRKMRELGRAEQELEDERQIFLQDKLAFDRAMAKSRQRTRVKGLLLVPILLVSSIGVGYASFTALSQDQFDLGATPSQLSALSERLRKAEIQNGSVASSQVGEREQMLQTLAQHPSSAGQDVQPKTPISTSVDELREQLMLMRQEMIDQNVLMDVDDAFIELQQAHFSNMSNHLVSMQKETLAKAEDYDRLLQANRALVKEINALRGERK